MKRMIIIPAKFSDRLLSKWFALLALSIVFLLTVSLPASALKEGETEFVEYNKQPFAVTVGNIYNDGAADIVISRPVPDFVKSIDVGESQRYYSNWQCFVVTQLAMSSSKSDILITRCVSEEIEKAVQPEIAEPEVKQISEPTVQTAEEKPVIEETTVTTPSTSNVTTSETEPVVEQPQSQEFLDKQVSMKSVLLVVFIMMMLLLVVLLSVFIYIRKERF